MNSLKFNLIVSVLLLSFLGGFSQSKSPIDLKAIEKWTNVGHPEISHDGKYAAFYIENEPTGFRTLLLTGTESAWNKKIIAKNFGYAESVFTNDSRYCAFTADDTLTIVTLGTFQITRIPNVSNAELLKGRLPYIIYRSKETPDQAVVYDPKEDKKVLDIDCESYVLSPDGANMVCKSTSKTGDKKICTVSWYNLSDWSHQVIWEGDPAGNFKFDHTGNKLALIIEQAGKPQDPKVGHLPNSLAIYTKGDKSAKIVCNSDTIGGDHHSWFAGIDNFNQEGNRIFLNITTTLPKPEPLKTNAKVDIYNFNDAVLQWRQLGMKGVGGGAKLLQHERTALFGINLENYSLYKLKESWEFNIRNLSDPYFNDHFMVAQGNGMSGISGNDDWNKAALTTVSLINTLNGKRSEIAKAIRGYETGSEMYQTSPDGQYVLYYDFNSRNYFSYEISTGRRSNLTRNIPVLWNEIHNGFIESDFWRLRGVAAWIKGSNDVLIYDQFDIWRIRLDGTTKPICITNRYGKLHDTKFYVLKDVFAKTGIPDGGFLYVSGFNEKNKKNGFFSIVSNRQQNPRLLTMGDCVYYVPDGNAGIVLGKGATEPIKAANTDKWIVCRQSATESRNYFFTSDFKVFKPLTDIHPEKSYNWLTTELITWKLPDGRISQGVLYKPENFDPKKKYPIIFNYYEYLSNNLNVFIQPEVSYGELSVPYYVSNGYLVFTPDIEGSKNGAGQDALNTMVSASKYLRKLPFIDERKMGLEGSSMGGYKTQFIITHSNVFVAANANCGVSNLSSMALFPSFNDDCEGTLQYGQFYLGYSIIDRPELYIKNSPIFYIKNIQTPLLVMHNPKDVNVTDTQSLDLFNAMRRAGKKIWLLQYDGAHHGLIGTENDDVAQTDWTIRQKQFFDYYLKGARAPKWMVEGVPARLKGVDNGLELMPKGVEVPESKLVIKTGSEGWSR